MFQAGAIRVPGAVLPTNTSKGPVGRNSAAQPRFATLRHRVSVATRAAKPEDASNSKSFDDEFNVVGRFEKFERILDDLLPEKDPGEFPATGAHPAGWEEETTMEDVEPFDPLRDGPLRYLGYANELGEAFNAWLPAGGVPLSYAIAIAYVLVDTADKGVAAKRDSEAQLERKSMALPTTINKRRLAALLAGERALDTVVWQLLASVAIPGFTIHQVVAITHALLHPHLQHLGNFEMQAVADVASSTHTELGFVLESVDKMVPTLMGLCAIPFIVHPIDEGVHLLLDKTLRPTMNSVICDRFQGSEAGLDACAEPFRDLEAAGEEEEEEKQG